MCKKIIVCVCLVLLVGGVDCRLSAEPSASPITPSPTPSGPPTTTIPNGGNYLNNYPVQSSMADHLALKRGTMVDLIFIGDSITQQWRWGNGLPVWKKYYEDRAIDFGVGGDGANNVLWRLENLPIRDFHPKAAVILIGTNHWLSTPEDIAAGVKSVIAKTKETFPGVKIVLVSILPNARANDKMALANAIIKTFADGNTVIWLDLACKFTPQGGNWKGLQNDKLHLSTPGYEMWAAELNPILDRIAPKAPPGMLDHLLNFFRKMVAPAPKAPAPTPDATPDPLQSQAVSASQSQNSTLSVTKGSIPMDILRFGSADSEKVHSFAETYSEEIKGGLGQSARHLLPLDPPQINGGNMTFVMKVDPKKRNYFTIKLWGDDDGFDEMGRLYLYIPKNGKDYQVGFRHEGDYKPLNIDIYYQTVPGRFFYSTTLLPLSMTEGKDEITLKIQSTGRIFDYGQGDESTGGNYQFFLKKPSRGIYAAYTHTDAMLAIPSDEVQGEVPPVTRIAASGESTLGPEGEFTKNINHIIEGYVNGGNLDSGKVETLAKAYGIPEVKTAYKNPKALEKVINSIDAIAAGYYKDPKKAPNDWGGKYGGAGRAIALLYPDLKDRLDEKVNYGPGGTQTRRQAWGDMLFASREYGRFKEMCALTNQTMIASGNVYKANRGLIVLGDSRAFSEEQAQYYLKSAAGIEPWFGTDLPDGGHEMRFGTNYFQVTKKGTTREFGFAGSGYGEVQNYVIEYFNMTGNPVFRDQAAKIARGRAPFRRPTAEKGEHPGEFVRGMQGIGEIAWRGGGTFGDHNMYKFRQPLHTAAVTLDPVLVGYAKQMIDDDNQFFAQLGNGGVGDLDVWSDYKAIKAATDNHARLPMTDGQPDFIWSDEENQVIAIKQGENRLWLTAYFQATLGVNSVGRFHYSTPRYEQYGSIVTVPEYVPSGEYAVRPVDRIDVPNRTHYQPPDPPLQAYGDEKLPVTRYPAEAKDHSPFVGRVDFSTVRFGSWLIGMNGSDSKTFTLEPPDGFRQARDLVSGKIMASPVSVKPLGTVVLDLDSTHL